ncbi:MAG: hypothetical protein HYR55_13740 [Acidobacteria bacterium]|nr:hypothetical protein [Acidobacteriota bacterium]MBI3656641.1 hypothetical protein [Acidobacteriota bacterium]
MTTITLEIPDELAVQINALRDRLPELLSRALAGASGAGTSQALKVATTHPVYRELMDFLGSGPAPQQIMNFKISAAAQDRLAELLEKNHEAGLTEAESAELDVYELVHHSVIRLKAHARLAKS